MNLDQPQLQKHSKLIQLSLIWKCAWVFFQPSSLNNSSYHTTFCGCDIGDSGASAFASALKVNSSLTDLDLKFSSLLPPFSFLYSIGNKIVTPGAVSIAKALKVNSTLTQLNFETNSSLFCLLKTFRLMVNKFGDEGASEFASALKVNSSLTSLDLNRITSFFFFDIYLFVLCELWNWWIRCFFIVRSTSS